MVLAALLPHLAGIADDLTIVRSMTTEQFNHAPAQLLMHTGSQLLGHASLGSWATYGLGTLNQDLPGFVVLVSGGKSPDAGKSVWGSGYLPGVYQGVQCRSSGDPILFVANPPGMSREVRRRSLDALGDLNRMQAERIRLAGYARAHRAVRAGVSHADLGARGDGHRRESPETLAAYGAEPGAASFANNCLLARRLVEQGVRFVQLFDWGWDGHGTGVNDDLVHQLPQEVPGDRPAGRGAHRRPEAARPARRHARDLGRRVRPHVDDGSPRRLDVPGPRSSSQGVHDAVRRRRHEARFTYGETDDFGYLSPRTR